MSLELIQMEVHFEQLGRELAASRRSEEQDELMKSFEETGTRPARTAARRRPVERPRIDPRLSTWAPTSF